MTNPDNVGGLPELPEPYQTVTIINHDASTRRTCGLHTDDSMRAYGELCRASPAGGDVVAPDAKFPDDGNGDDDAYNKGWNDCRAFTIASKYAKPKDSAPAGSGEVSIDAAWLELVANRWDKSQKISPMECDRLLSIAALLRKLQQGGGLCAGAEGADQQDGRARRNRAQRERDGRSVSRHDRRLSGPGGRSCA